MTAWSVAAVMLSFLCCARTDAQSRQSILEEKGDAVRVTILDASTQQPIVRTNVDAMVRVVCDTAPCPPRVVWTGTTDRGGSIAIPRRFLTGALSTRGHEPREVRSASWHVANGVGRWTLPLLPRPVTTCRDAASAFQVLAAADGRSAEVLHDGRAVQFGVMSCSAESEPDPRSHDTIVRRCWSAGGVADAGFFVIFTRSADNRITARVQANSIRVATDVAALSCAASEPSPADDPTISIDPGDWTLEYSVKGGEEPRFRTLTLTQAGQFTGVDKISGHLVSARAPEGLMRRVAQFLKNARDERRTTAPGPDQIRVALVVTTGGRTYRLDFSDEVARLLDDAFVDAIGQALAGSWYESAWKLCRPVPSLAADDVDPPIETLALDGRGGFSVTWPGGPRTTGPPHVFVADYRGWYVVRPDLTTIVMHVEGPPPKDFSGEGSFSIEGNSLTFRNIWFGTKRAKHKPDICELTFTRK